MNGKAYLIKSDMALFRKISPQSTAVHLIRSGELAAVGEVKHKPDGATERVDCHPLVMAEGHAILLHQLTRTWKLGKTVIGPPLITFGFYPKGTPYNIYAWFDERDSLKAAYFNVVSRDGFWVHDSELHYDDRVIDLLCLPGEPVHVLDEDELWQLEPEPRSEAMEAARWLEEHWDSELGRFFRVLREVLTEIK